jgi:hypothetical protein
MAKKYAVMVEIEVDSESRLDARGKVAVRMQAIWDMCADLYPQHLEGLEHYFVTGDVKELD